MSLQVAAPEYVTKAFHPKTVGHTLIKNATKLVIRVVGGPRPVNADQGIAYCKPSHTDGDPVHSFSRESALSAITDFCNGTQGTPLGLIETTQSDGEGGTIIVTATKNARRITLPRLVSLIFARRAC
ncbi:MAG: hypothetical protein M1813_009756 [Trichoglossum hirsutum]|nr:MAG: hypothetical protein M1813_009756 [Trichoglossum hirsutum]